MIERLIYLSLSWRIVMNKKSLIALGTGLALSLASASVALAETQGDMQANGVQSNNGTQMQTNDTVPNNKTDGKCGADKTKTDGKCGAAKCGADKGKTDGKCGAGKCGANKS